MTYYNARGEAMPESAAEQARIAGTAAANETINAPAGHSSLSGEGGGDVLVGNGMDNRHWITHPRDRVVEQPGGGVDTMIGWTDLRLADNVENLVVNGQFNYAVGNGLANLITVDDATHWIYGAGGDDVLVGALTQKTTFVVRAGEGSDVIYNWNGNSQLQLHGYGVTSAAQLRSMMSQQGNDVVISFGNGERLILRDELLSTIQDRQFLLPLDTSKLGGLTFQDEFNAFQLWNPSTDTGIWRADFGGNLKDQWAYTLVSNGEVQVYAQPGFQGRGEADLDINPFSISNGVLTITAERIPDSKSYAAWNREYSSGMLNTFGMFEQKYGYFEIRAEMPTAAGSWPAFWMMTHPYVSGIEADIFEGLAITPEIDYRRALGGDQTQYDDTLKLEVGGMHTYGMLWTPETVTFYYDGIAVLQGPTPDNWDYPMALIVNLAVGGWGGPPDHGQFPTQMKVDYVRAYALASGQTEVVRESPEIPVGTVRAVGGQTSGQANVPETFADGQPVTSATIAIHGARPASGPPGKAFVIWEDAGAVFGAVSNNGVLGQPTTLMAGSVGQFTGTGTWLSSGKVVFGYTQADGAGRSAWAMVFDPVKQTFTRQELGPVSGDVRFVATDFGGFAASWDTPDGRTLARAYDEWAYGGDVPGWYGPVREIAGDLTGVTASGELIATNGSGLQQLYRILGASQPNGGGSGGSSAATNGNDALQAAPGRTPVHALAGDDTVTGTAGEDYLRGDEGNDRIVGGDAFDDVHGNMGNDTVIGGGGADWVVGGKDNDQLMGDDGDDIVYGNMGDDWCEGGAGADIVRGGQGSDQLFGHAGNDWLSGDRGDDTLSGGAGADIFHVFAEAGLDRVTDFNAAEGDRVQLLPGMQYSVVQAGADTVVQVGSAQLVLANVQMASLSPGWIFAG
ncbi:family 16 glycosylhydrolase [Phenylobacterium sp.]|uniref:family 16 glycosylhydrolase n=1 Tax=Phenylobacterium sp. TaxID=1871053 RepID=UPI0035AFDABF